MRKPFESGQYKGFPANETISYTTSTLCINIPISETELATSRSRKVGLAKRLATGLGEAGPSDCAILAIVL
jgi:hypothetical protein